MMTNHILLAFFWTIYCLLHSILADLIMKKKIKKIMGGSYKYYRLMYSIFAFVSFIAILWFAIRMPSVLLFLRNNFLLIVGIIVGFSGCLIMIACISNICQTWAVLKISRRKIFLINWSLQVCTVTCGILYTQARFFFYGDLLLYYPIYLFSFQILLLPFTHWSVFNSKKKNWCWNLAKIINNTNKKFQSWSLLLKWNDRWQMVDDSAN